MKSKSVRLPEHIKPERYKLHLTPDFQEFTFYGEETIDLLLTKSTNVIILHALELEVSEAKFVHQDRTEWIGKVKYDSKAETVSLTFPKNIPSGLGGLLLKFKGILNNQMKGFYRSKYQVDGQEKYLATTQFESTDARRAFPCFDEPSIKAIFDVSLTIPKDMTAISNTIESTVLEHQSGFKIVQFEPTPKMSTYLLAFIIGHFDFLEGKTKGGVRVRIFATPGKKHQLKFALKVAIRCLEFYEDYFAIPYPLPSLDLIAIPDFAAGAMENWGAITYRENALLLDPEKSSAGNRQRVAIVIAHELAHQWFGNLVTMEWWTHLWLNEGFASYMEYLVTDVLFPRWQMWTQFVHEDQGEALNLDSLKTTHPIEVEMYHPREIEEIFDAVSYSKGASVIRMLANYLGKKDFRDGLRFYLKKHQFANAKTEDLWTALEKVSGKPIKKIMGNWTSKPGYPVISYQTDHGKLKLSQSRYFSSQLTRFQEKDKTIWSIPLTVCGKTGQLKNYLMESQIFETDTLPNMGWMKLNYQESSFIRVSYQPEDLKFLKRIIKNKQLGAIDRLGILRDVFDLAEPGYRSVIDGLNLALEYMGEEDYTVWVELAHQINKIDGLIFDQDFYLVFAPYAKKIFSKIAAKMGWKKKRGKDHTDTLLRSLALYNAGKFGDMEVVGIARKKFEDHISGKKLIESDIRAVVYNLVAQYGGEKEYQQLVKMYQDESMHQEKDRLFKALASFEDKAILKKTLGFMMTDQVRLQDKTIGIAAVGLNPFGRKLAWNFIKNNWPQLRRWYSSGFILFGKAFMFAQEFTKPQEANDIKRFFAKNPTPELNRKINQTVEQIMSNSVWLKRDKKNIKQFLKTVEV